jgi:hypothetical protein
MGICEKIILPKVLKLLSNINLPKIRMIELGNQHFNDGRISKDYYSGIGIEHVSIDINGLDNSLKLDLNFDIDIPKADVVTNHGTTEHVSNQEAVFRNIHNLCKTNGYMIHQVPSVGTWPGHCDFYYTKEYFEDLAKKNNYIVIENTKLNEGRYVGIEDMIWCIFQKKEDCDFIL